MAADIIPGRSAIASATEVLCRLSGVFELTGKTMVERERQLIFCRTEIARAIDRRLGLPSPGSRPKATELATAMRELWPNGWQAIDDAIAACALDKFVAERIEEYAQKLTELLPIAPSSLTVDAAIRGIITDLRLLGEG